MLNPKVPPELDRILARMMARDPRSVLPDGQQAVVELERTNLSAAVPSFADQEKARQEPVDAGLISPRPPSPTRPRPLSLH